VRDTIFIKGAKANNLKNIDLEIPRNKLVVFTGLSGSGKSSLAFDTLYAEGQRRYMESLSSYARQFLGQMEKPEVEYIEGLSPSISIDQKTTSRNPRSTVGTVTEIHDYFRLLYARIGMPHCPKCGKRIEQQTVDQMVEQVAQLPEGTRIQVLAPVIRGRKGEYHKLLENIQKSGFVRVRIDGSIYELGEEIQIEKNNKHSIEAVVDRLVVREGISSRLTDSIETALKLAEGLVIIDVIGETEILFSQNYACADCGISLEELEPRLFSFNSPFGACPHCTGLGTIMAVDPALIVPDTSLSLEKGAIRASGWYTQASDSMNKMYFAGLAKHYKFDVNTPFKDLPKKIQHVILYGSGSEKVTFEIDRSFHKGTFTQAFEGVISSLERRYRETNSDGVKQEIEQLMTENPCEVCKGTRFKPEALAVTVGGLNISQISHKSVTELIAFLQKLKLNKKDTMIAERILKEILERLGFLENVGLDYLTLARPAGTLSGGEAQRIRLATQIGAGLMGVLYILDEPSIGLHQRDNARLLATLKRLRDLGNTLVVVEHDEETMMAADYIVDIGPGAGAAGGEVVATGTPAEIMACKRSITGQYLSGEKFIPVPSKRRPTGERWLTVKNAHANNLKHIDVQIPIGVITCVTGVSGSGKSSLVNEVLYKMLARELNRAHTVPGKCDGISGMEQLDKVIVIDQSPIGRTPRSNPATYTGVFDFIRSVFAQTQDAKMKGYNNSRFSFNVKGGRCEACSGDGILKIEMHFMPDIYVPCEVCRGKRYNKETLEVRYKGKNIYEVLDMTVEDAVEFFKNIPQIQRKMQTLYDVGLGYIRLGQPSTTLSGGEAQRIKLATELSKRGTGKTIYILDEPTTGLHTADVDKLITILDRLAHGGNTIVIIEHNLDVIKVADYCIDLGPEGGDKGGAVVACGTPEELCQVPESYTGQFLQRVLTGHIQPAPKATKKRKAKEKQTAEDK